MSFITGWFHSIVQWFGDAAFASTVLSVDVIILILLFVFLLRITWPAGFLCSTLLNSNTRIGIVVGIRQLAWCLFIIPLSVTESHTENCNLVAFLQDHINQHTFPAKGELLVSCFQFDYSKLEGPAHDFFVVQHKDDLDNVDWHEWTCCYTFKEKTSKLTIVHYHQSKFIVAHPATLQIKGFSPVCSLWCVFSCPLWVNALPHEG